jgi:hypothetical protein
MLRLLYKHNRQVQPSDNIQNTAKAIRNPFSRFVWRLWSLAGLASALGFLGSTLWYEIQPDEDLKDACSYFRDLFSEGYDCQCLI